ncbi:hypothetical protein ACVFMH_17550 [Pseudomonas aeruginosa]
MIKIDDILLGIRQAKDIASERTVSSALLIEIAYKLDIRLFIRIPSNDIDTFLLGTSNKRMLSAFPELASDNWPFDYDRPMQIGTEIEYFCLEPDEYKLILQKIKISKSNFSYIGIYQEGVGLIKLDPTDYARRLATSKPEIRYITGSFRTFEKNKKSTWGVPEHEKSIDFSFADLLVAPQDIPKLSAELELNTPAGASIPDQWMSEWLHDLNELHVHFFPPGNQVGKALLKKTKKDIEEVLRNRWITKNKNTALFRQAVFAILPDRLYPDKPKDKKPSFEIQEQFKNCSSTALLLINQEAKKLWEEKQLSPDKKYLDRKSIITELRGLDLTENLSTAAARIIRPDSEQRMAIFRKGSS